MSESEKAAADTRRLTLFMIGAVLFLLGALVMSAVSNCARDRTGCTYGTVKTMVTEQDGTVHIVCAAPPARPECSSLPVHAWDLKVVPHDREARDAAVAELEATSELAKESLVELMRCEKESKGFLWQLHACEVGRTLDASQCTVANAPAKSPSSSATAVIENKK